MYKGLAIYIGEPGWPQGGEQGLGQGEGGANTILAWAELIHHPEGEGAQPGTGPVLHPQHSPCTQHYQNIDQKY